MGKTKGILFGVIAVLASTPAFAAEIGTAANFAGLGYSVGYAALGLGIMMGVAVLGGALGQGKAASAALDGIARNPGAATKILIQLMLGLAFMESLVLFSLIIVLKLSGSIANVLDLMAK